METTRHVLARDHPRPSTREDLRRSRSTSLGQTGLRGECLISPVVSYKIFMFSPRYMRPASAISWGCWLRPGGHSSNVDNLGKIFSHSKQGKSGKYVPPISQNISPAGKRCKLGMSWPSVNKHLCVWSAIRCEELCANIHP